MKPVLRSLVWIAFPTLFGCAQATARGELAAVQAQPAAPADVVAELIRLGDQQVGRRNWARARDAYADAADRERARGVLPEVPLRRIANTHFFLREDLAAALVLDRLADEAAGFGDLHVQAQAIADAIGLYAGAGRMDEARDRLRRLERLLGSPFLPDSLREPITRRIAAP